MDHRRDSGPDPDRITDRGRPGVEPSRRTWIDYVDAAPESQGIDVAAVRHYRLARVRAEMEARDVAAVILSDPVNIRYATGARNMQVFTARNTPARYLVLTAERSILHELAGCEHLVDGLDTIDDVRPAVTASYVAAGPAIAARERDWAEETSTLLRDLLGPGRHRVGLERMNAGAALALAATDLELVDAQEPVERARAIKSDGEVACLVTSLRMAEAALGELRAALAPGMTENELWSILHRAVIAGNGDYCETRLLNSGPRTNPWFQEATSRVIEPDELVAIDTDVVGCHGYYADFSRTFHVGPGEPTAEQRNLYRLANEQLEHNLAVLGPGITFREYAERAWDIPAPYRARRYYLSAHGCGMTGEYPYLYHQQDFAGAGYDGVVEPGMVLCVESYIGHERGGEGVKLEQQILVTDAGIEMLSRFPLERSLLA